jgi:short-subunit dehydrogenase
MSKVIVITGASSGIGAALAQLAAANGHRVVLAARREKELRELAAGMGKAALTVVTDVTKRADVDRLKSVALEKFGQIDVWVNNAGRGISRNVTEVSDDDIDEMMLVNVKSALYGMQTILPYFKERGAGQVINISSFLSRVPFVTFRSAYSAAKAALNILTANLRMELRKDYLGIHVSLVMPGVVLTDFPRNALGSAPPVRSGGAMQPQTAEDVAKAIAEVIEHPQAEVYTNPASAPIARRYYEDVGAFEAGMP